jgi:hypothetical protein
VLYNPSRRAAEFDLFPMCRELGIPVMVYSPIEQGRIIGNPVLRDIAIRHRASPAQVALAWVLRRGDVCAIPRSGSPEHTYENRAALDITLDHEDLVALDAEFPPPLHAQPLEMLQRRVTPPPRPRAARISAARPAQPRRRRPAAGPGQRWPIGRRGSGRRRRRPPSRRR